MLRRPQEEGEAWAGNSSHCLVGLLDKFEGSDYWVGSIAVGVGKG